MRFAVPDSDSDDLVSLDLSYISDTSEEEYDDLPGPSEWVFATTPRSISSLFACPTLDCPRTALASWLRVWLCIHFRADR